MVPKPSAIRWPVSSRKWILRSFDGRGVDGFDTYKQEAYDTINGCQKSLSPADRQPFASCMRRTMTYADIISRSQNDQTERFGFDFSLGP